MATPTISGTFLSNPEGGAEYGVDYGAPGLLGAPVFSPVAGRVIGYTPSSGGSPGWDPGRLLIQAVDGTVVGIGHITSSLAPGTMLMAGQQVGTIGNSSFYSGTPESNAHVEVMSGTSTSTFKSGGQAKVLADEALAALALGGQSGTTSTTGMQQTGFSVTGNYTYKSLNQSVSDAVKNGGTGSTFYGPITGFESWISQGTLLRRVGFTLFGVFLIWYGLHLLTRSGVTSPTEVLGSIPTGGGTIPTAKVPEITAGKALTGVKSFKLKAKGKG